MIGSTEDLTFIVPLGLSEHHLAQEFGRQHPSQPKAKQVYLNTLAVSAVKFYLRCMGIETEEEASSSWNPLMQSLIDVADLSVKDCGILECRPVLPESSAVYIPPEAWFDRIGYIAVQLNQSLTEATLLGFTKTVDTPEVALSCLQSMADLLLHLHQIRQPVKASLPSNAAAISNSTLVNLSQWLENIFETSWQSLETIFGTDRPHLAASFRTALRSNEVNVKRAKLLDVGLQLEKRFLALLIAVTPETDCIMNILVQVHPDPVGSNTYLPAKLKLCLLSESGETLQEVHSRSYDNYIQLKRFRGFVGERFQLEVILNDVRIREAFVI